MDLEALPPEDPTPAGGEHPGAPGPAWAPPPWQPAWGTDPTITSPSYAPGGDGTPPPKRLGFSRTTKVVSGAVALALVAGGAWAAGTALHGGGSTVRFQPAAATTSATGSSGTSGGTTGGSGTAPAGPHYRVTRGLAGTVGTVDPSANSFTVNAPTLPPKPTPGAAPATPPAPTTKSVTVKTTAQTQYITVTQGSASGLAAGMQIIAVGDVTNSTLTATHVAAAQAGLLPSRPKPPTGAAPTPPPGAPALPANHPGAAVGTIASITKDQPAAGDLTLQLTTARGSRTVVVTPSTTIALATKGSSSAVKPGDMVLVRGTHNTDGSVTASTVITVSASLRGTGGTRGFPFGPALGLGPWLRLGGGPGFFGGHGFLGGLGRFGFGHRSGSEPVPGSGSEPAPGSGSGSGSGGTGGSSGSGTSGSSTTDGATTGAI